MRIHEIRFSNLNSLTGGWSISFDHPAYTSEGIFSITGPTGSGKTTILDALCLALYGQTPRLGKITQGANGVMSRHTQSCMAEVTFSTQAGLFRCHFSQGRTKHGDLKPPRREIVNAESGEILENKLTSVAARVVAETGMEFGQFTRSMLLAQGGFAAFLEASGDDRSKILEKITGTGIYSIISRTVHEKHRVLKETKNRLAAEIAGIVVLSDEDRVAKEKALTGERERAAKLSAELASVQQGIVWRTNLAALAKEQAAVCAEQEALAKEIEAFAGEKARLARGLAAQGLAASWSSLSQHRSEEKKEACAYAAKEAQLPALRLASESAAKALAIQQNALLNAKKAYDELAPLLTSVRALDATVEERAKALAAVSERCSQAKTKVEREAAEVTRLEKGLLVLGLEAEKLARDREARARDALIEGALAGVREQLAALAHARTERERKEKDVALATTKRAQAEKTWDVRKKAVDSAQKKGEEAALFVQRVEQSLQDVLCGKLLREYRDEKEHLLRESLYLHTIQDLEEERARLVAGKPCPLCGSCEHPYALHTVPKPDAVEAKIASVNAVILKAEGLEATQKKAQKALSSAREELGVSEKAAVEARCAFEACTQTLAALEAESVQAKARHEAMLRATDESLAPFGITLATVADPLRVLQERSAQWKQLGERAAALEAKKAEQTAQHRECTAVLAREREALSTVTKEYEESKALFEADRARRVALFGDRQPDVQEEKAKAQVLAAEKEETACRKKLEEATLNEARAKADRESQSARLEAMRRALIDEERSFAEARRAAGFEDEAAYVAAILKPGEQDELTMREERLTKRSYTLLATRAEREKRLASEMAKNVTPLTLDQLAEEKTRLLAESTQSQETHARLAHELARNAEAKQRLADKEKEREALDREYAVWNTLHAMIGSNDGQKYCAFAQGLTFEVLIAQANAQLRHMTDRYRLVRDADTPMALNVIDRYQADAVRSIKNLSGGESFLVSLSLALGLSSIASNSVRVESLFLDEGFGTLDETALDMALQTLANLREEGTLICVISHIRALQDRISTQIRVDATSGGVSVLSGPGVTRF